MRRLSWVLLCLGIAACGEDEPLPCNPAAGADAGDGVRDGDFALSDSRILEQLADPDTRRGLCVLLGLITAAQVGADQAACESFVEVCEQTPTPDPSGSLPVVSNDLSGLLGCPTTASAVDACAADLLVVVGDSFGEMGCSATDLAPTQASALLTSAGCAQVLFACPNLIAPLLQAAQGAN